MTAAKANLGRRSWALFFPHSLAIEVVLIGVISLNTVVTYHLQIAGTCIFSFSLGRVITRFRPRLFLGAAGWRMQSELERVLGGKAQSYAKCASQVAAALAGIYLQDG